MIIEAYAPGRVNLIGDHTDYTGGLVLPMAIDMGTTVRFSPAPRTAPATTMTLRSDADPEPAAIERDVVDPTTIRPAWARYVAGIVVELRAAGHDVSGGEGTVTTTLPLGAGLSSSAALEVAVALALGANGSPLEIAKLCRRAEQLASGVPCGIMDQLVATAGVEECALLIDCRSLTVDPVRIPDELEVVVVDSAEHRALAGSPYAERRADCEHAADLIGPLRHAARGSVERIPDDRLRRRARHVVTENQRVAQAADALRTADLERFGRLIRESHRSLRDDFEVSTPALDTLVDRLNATAGVFGARLTGAGFGGCAVAMVEPGTVIAGRRVHASAGARVRALS
ncbi:MAG: galactokinase [Candidatus Dormibacteraeota bacterium]|nr:galactokinase [Candidatus Dormibacteraeota bacterium]